MIEVPVAVVGEVSGNVNSKDEKDESGLGRIIVNLYSSGKLAATTLSEADGYFNFPGLAPGNYTVSIDKAQLRRLSMTSSPSISFTIKTNREGDIVDGLKFFCESFNTSLGCSIDIHGLLKDTDGDGVPDCRDTELITPTSCFPVDKDGVGKCSIQ